MAIPRLARRRAAIGLGGLGALALTIWAHAEATSRRSALPPEADLLYLPRAEVIRVAAIGHTELAADLVWVRAVIYSGEELAHRGRMQWLDRYLDTLLTLDPTFRRPYQWAGVVTMYNGRPITNEMVRASNRYLELGAARFPGDWEFPFMLGANYLSELKTDDPAQKAKWRRLAGEYIRRAASLGGGPSWLPLLAATLFSQEGATDLAIRHLEEVYASTEDPRVREDVRKRLNQLRAATDADRIEKAHRVLEAGWRAWAPYAPVDLFVVVGAPRADATLDRLVGQPLLDETPVEPGVEPAVEPPDRTPHVGPH